MRRPWVRFLLAVPAVVLLVLVLAAAFLGPADPRTNLATTLTWNVWFCLLFVLIVLTGRGWCLVCPFGAVAEWVQRRALWGPGRPLGWGRVLPPRLTRPGYLLPIGSLVVLTWVEQRFAIAEGGPAVRTGYLLAAVLVLTVAAFLVFRGRTSCRYLCPLSGMIGILGAVAPLAGFRSRQPQACRECRTRDCLRGPTDPGGCPWYAWPGSEESNLSCGLCAECVTACPDDRVGLYLTAPLDSVVAVRHRRADVAWGVAVLVGLAVQEQVRLTGPYRGVRGWVDRLLPVPGVADPAVFLGCVAGVALALAGLAQAVAALGDRVGVAGSVAAGPVTRTRPDTSFVFRRSRFRSVFLPLSYALIPLAAADYLACQVPAFVQGAGAALPALAHPFTTAAGRGTPGSLLPVAGIVAVQVVVLVGGVLASLLAGWRIGAAAGQGGSPGWPPRLATGAAVLVLAVVLVLLVLAPVLGSQPSAGTTTQPWLT